MYSIIIPVNYKYIFIMHTAYTVNSKLTVKFKVRFPSLERNNRNNGIKRIVIF